MNLSYFLLKCNSIPRQHRIRIPSEFTVYMYMSSIYITQCMLFLCTAESALYPPSNEMNGSNLQANAQHVQHMEADASGTRLEGSLEWGIPFSAQP